MLGLDEHAQKTRRLSETALRVRQAFFPVQGAGKSSCSTNFRWPAASTGPRTSLALPKKLVGALRELKAAQAALYEFMHRALCASFGLADTMHLNELRGVLRGRCHGLDQYTVDVQGLRSFIRRVCESAATDEPSGFDSILLFLGHNPAAKWTDQDRDTAEYRLAEFSKRLPRSREAPTALSRLDEAGLHPRGDPRQDGPAGLDGEIDEVVSLNQRNSAAIADAKRRIQEVLVDVDDQELAPRLDGPD